MKSKSKNKGLGFTLVELLVVIAIIGLIASVITVAFNTARAKARDVKRAAEMQQLRKALELFYGDHQRYPGSQDGISLSGEMLGDGAGSFETAMAPYITVPKDPRHDGTTYYYSYDPWHNICEGGAVLGTGAVLAFNRAETGSIQLVKQTTCGGDMNQDNAHYNLVFQPTVP